MHTQLMVFGTIISLSFLVFIVLILTDTVRLRKSSTEKTTLPGPSILQSPKNPHVDRYIMPKEFNVGLIKQKDYKSANLCNQKVLYPINELEVDYGWKMPKCLCTQFVQAP